MRLSLDSYHGALRSTRRKSLALLILGGVGLVWGVFWLLMGFLMIITSEQPMDMRAGLFCGVLAGALPTIAATLLVWRGYVAMRRVLQLQALAALARERPVFDSRDVRRTLDLDGPRAEALLVDARRLGVLVDEDASASASAPAGPAGAGLVGHVLNGTYAVEARLGAGGMGTVYLATHARTGRRYAVKVLHPDAALSPDAIRRFEREATAASSLGHPGIVGVHDVDQTPDGVHYIVMDLLEGETLERRLERVGCLPWAEARRITVELGDALAAAHDAGLLHRDLKPANVFLAAPDARAVLLDFGLAKKLDDAAVSRITETGAAVGTPLYMSPEQARGEPVDVRTDLYGLAAVVFEMVTGAPPFMDRTTASVYAKLLTEDVPAASALAPHPCPPGLDELLARGLAKTPDERFDDARSMTAALGSLEPVGQTA